MERDSVFSKENVGVANVLDEGKVVYTTKPISVNNGDKRYDTVDKANKIAVEWLNNNYPVWWNPNAYRD